MRMSIEDFTAEVYKRRDEIKEKRKRRAMAIKYLVPIALCFVLSFSMITVVMPILLSGKSGVTEGKPDNGIDGNSGIIKEESNDNSEIGGTGYLIEISYVTVYSAEGRTVYNNAEDIWDVFLGRCKINDIVQLNDIITARNNGFIATLDGNNMEWNLFTP